MLRKMKSCVCPNSRQSTYSSLPLRKRLPTSMSRKVSLGCPLMFSVPLKRVGPTCDGAGVLCHMPPESMLVCVLEWGREDIIHNTKTSNEVDSLLHKCRLKLKRIDLPLFLFLLIHLHPTQDTFGKKDRASIATWTDSYRWTDRYSGRM